MADLWVEWFFDGELVRDAGLDGVLEGGGGHIL